jgi:hypothetical protein
MKPIITLLGEIAKIPSFLIYHSMSWGYVMYKFWYWFLLPVFPNMPHIGFWQAVGLHLFSGMFKNHKVSVKMKEEFIKKDDTMISSLVAPWLMLLVGLLMLQFIN